LELTDQELVARCQRGDHRAFRVLVDKYQRRAYGIAMGILRNPDDARDAAQEAFIKVFRNVDGFKGDSSFYTWLYRIVVNVCIDHIRKNKRHRELEFDDGLRHDGEDGGMSALPLSSLGDPAQVLQRREILDAVQDGLQYLSDKHRAVIIMRELQGMSYEEMAQAMKCQKGTIMSRLFHARRNMQKLLTERLGYVPSSLADETGEDRDASGVATPQAVLP